MELENVPVQNEHDKENNTVSKNYLILSERLEKLLAKEGLKDLAIIVDGTYLTKSSKMLYVSLVNNKGISEFMFFIKSSKTPKIEIIEDGMDIILKSILKDTIYDISFGVHFNAEDCVIQIDPDMKIVIIESGIYHAVKCMASDEKYLSKSWAIKDVNIEQSVLPQVVSKFKEAAYDNYKSVIYSKSSNRFIHKITKSSKFYKILKSFVPVFIKYKYLYDPLSDNPDIDVSIYKLAGYAKEKGREPINFNSLHCYMLTHEEICKCFGMSHFVRFTPSFVYEIFVGLLNPTLGYYPNKLNEAYVKSKISDTTGKGLKPCFLKNDYLGILYSLNNIVNDPNSKDEDKQYAIDTIEELETYINSNTLYFACVRNRNFLVNYGPSILDSHDKITDTALYNYLSEASLLLN